MRRDAVAPRVTFPKSRGEGIGVRFSSKTVAAGRRIPVPPNVASTLAFTVKVELEKVA